MTIDLRASSCLGSGRDQCCSLTVATMPKGSESLPPQKAPGRTSRPRATAAIRFASARISTASAIGSNASSTRSSTGNTSCKWSDLPALEAVNVRGTRNVVDAALERGVRRLVYTSTTSTVGAFDDAGRTADESVPLTGYRARSPYAVTKQQAERIVVEANARGLEKVILNPAEVVGASSATVKRDWTAARAWLNRELVGGSIPS